MKHIPIIFGTYTKRRSQGLYGALLDVKNRTFHSLKLLAEAEHPTYPASDPEDNLLISNRMFGKEAGLESFRIKYSEDSFQLVGISKSKKSAGNACYVAVDRPLCRIYSTLYHEGQINTHLYDESSGQITHILQIIQRSGSSLDPERQTKSHPHISLMHDHSVYVCDLGTDEIIRYDKNEYGLEEAAKLSLKPGSGPRHLVFHPSLPLFYVVNELSNELLLVSLHEDGTMKAHSSHSTLPADNQAASIAAAIRISSDGRFVYVSNRGYDSIAVFALAKDGLVKERIQIIESGGIHPRDFALSPREEFLICAHEQSDRVTLFERDADSGLLQRLEESIEVPEAVCVHVLPEMNI